MHCGVNTSSSSRFLNQTVTAAPIIKAVSRGSRAQLAFGLDLTWIGCAARRNSGGIKCISNSVLQRLRRAHLDCVLDVADLFRAGTNSPYRCVNSCTIEDIWFGFRASLFGASTFQPELGRKPDGGPTHSCWPRGKNNGQSVTSSEPGHWPASACGFAIHRLLYIFFAWGSHLFAHMNVGGAVLLLVH